MKECIKEREGLEGGERERERKIKDWKGWV